MSSNMQELQMLFSTQHCKITSDKIHLKMVVVNSFLDGYDTIEAYRESYSHKEKNMEFMSASAVRSSEREYYKEAEGFDFHSTGIEVSDCRLIY